MAPLSTTVLVGTTSLSNLASARHRPPSLAPPREEGWTEVWGGKDRTADDDGTKKGGGNGGVDGEGAVGADSPFLPPRYVTVLEDGCDNIGVTPTSGTETAKAEGVPALTLTQYRVAWFEQAVLRMCRIPHRVENSGYAAMESTGGLPYVLDVSTGEKPPFNGSEDVVEEQSLPSLDGPVLVGRNQPGGLGSTFFHQFDGKNKPTSHFLSSGSHIVDYLRLRHSHQMKDHLLFPEHLQGPQSADALAYETLIREKLDYILLALRYGHDPAWEGVYKPQIVTATLDPNGEHAAKEGGKRRRLFFPLWAWYQAYSERALGLHNILPSAHAVPSSTRGGLALDLFRYNDHRCSCKGEDSETSNEDEDGEEAQKEEEVHQHHPFSSFFPSRAGGGGGDTGKVNVHRAMEVADVYYASLEEKLASCSTADGAVADNDQMVHLLGTEKPSYVDAMLFAHLAEALCDVHLVLVLAKRPRLIRYFQRMYDLSFGDSDDSWIKNNNAVNALNAFNQIPVATSAKPGAKSAVTIDEDGHDMVRAIKLMRQMAVHCHELDEALRDAAALRLAEGGGEKSVLDSYQRPIGARLYRWIMGGEVSFWGSGTVKSTDADDGIESENAGDDESQAGDGQEKETSPEEDNKQRMYREHMKRMKRDRRTHDELWLSGVVVTVVAALVISASGKPKQ